MANIPEVEAETIEIQEYKTAIRCLICGKEVITPDSYHYPIPTVCDDCKRAIELVKTLYKDKPCWDCKDSQCGVCTKVITFGG